MQPRRILVVLNGSDSDPSLLNQTLAFCASHQASLDGLFVRRNAASGGDFLGDAFSTYGMEAVLEALDDAAAKASEEAHAAFNTAADDAPDNSIGRFIEYVGLPRLAMEQEGRLSDLIVMQKPEGATLSNQLNAIETAAFESGRPVLILPVEREPADDFDNVVVAWDGSLEATRAVVGAMPFLQSAQSVKVLHAGADAEAAEQLADLSSYLALHNVKAATRTVPLEGRSAARALIETSQENGAELVVMGGFGAPGWQRSLGRDETTSLLKGMPFAILLAH